MAVSRLELAPLRRNGMRSGDITLRGGWSWDFVVDGVSLYERIRGDVAGVLGWGVPEHQALVVEKLMCRAPPDLPPDRVALYVCPECGELGCGGVTTAVARAGDLIVWRGFGWERDDGGVTEPVDLGPFAFDRGAYGRLLRAALSTAPGEAPGPLRNG